MTLNKTLIIRSLLAFILSSLLTWICLHPQGCNEPEKHEEGKQVQALKTEAQKVVTIYASAKLNRQQRADTLKRHITITGLHLSDAAVKSNSRKNTVLKRINSIPEDTAALVADCDSLKKETAVFMESVSLQDSLQEKLITDLWGLSVQKDSALADCDMAFETMSDLAGQSLAEQEHLTRALEKEKQKAKRTATVNRILTGAAAVLAGITTLLILK